MATGAYISTDFLNMAFGSETVSRYATIKTAGEATSDARLAQGIAWAERSVENQFRASRYAVPFSLNTTDLAIVKHWMAVYALHWLRLARGIDTTEIDQMQEEKRRVDKEITRYARGIDVFGSGDRDTIRPEAPFTAPA
jgi:hypothetical protein